MIKNHYSPHLLLAQILLPALLSSTDVSAQQTGDPDFNPPIIAPAFATGKGPVVLIDEAHHNFHTADGRYRALADLLRRDGYVVRGIDSRFSRTNLDGADMLVIANALHERNEEDWSLPTPSALDDGEIEAVVTWVADGGALLLIADHMPFPGATARLAEHFGILFANGFALRADSTGQIRFWLSDLTLRPHAITRGRSRAEAIDSVTSFTGQAFRTDPERSVEPLLVLADGTLLLLPTEAWQFSETTPSLSAKGLLQGAVARYGSGRVAVFGEAAMFTAQLAGPRRLPVGMNSPDAPQNAQFLLNVVHWLSGLLSDD